MRYVNRRTLLSLVLPDEHNAPAAPAGTAAAAAAHGAHRLHILSFDHIRLRGGAPQLRVRLLRPPAAVRRRRRRRRRGLRRHHAPVAHQPVPQQGRRGADVAVPNAAGLVLVVVGGDRSLVVDNLVIFKAVEAADASVHTADAPIEISDVSVGSKDTSVEIGDVSVEVGDAAKGHAEAVVQARVAVEAVAVARPPRRPVVGPREGPVLEDGFGLQGGNSIDSGHFLSLSKLIFGPFFALLN